MREFAVSSQLAAPAETVWQHAISPSGINRELMPLVRMTFPAGAENFSEQWKPGQRLFRSWILLGGLLPVDYDDIALLEVEPGHRFLEHSTMLTQKSWRHERTIEPIPCGCRVTDRVAFNPRISFLGPLYAPIFKAAFALRHRNLRRLFGAANPSET